MYGAGTRNPSFLVPGTGRWNRDNTDCQLDSGDSTKNPGRIFLNVGSDRTLYRKNLAIDEFALDRDDFFLANAYTSVAEVSSCFRHWNAEDTGEKEQIGSAGKPPSDQKSDPEEAFDGRLMRGPDADGLRPLLLSSGAAETEEVSGGAAGGCQG